MILTTSRRPSAKSRNLCRELQAVIPLSHCIMRGKKGVRELLSLAVEKGADRIVIVTSEGSEPRSLLFYAEWNFLGELFITAHLRKELMISKITPLYEDVPFLLQSSEKNAEVIAHFFGAQIYDGIDADTFMTYENGWIDFYRLEICETFVGPRIHVDSIL
mgnify:CR=1 FL=1